MTEGTGFESPLGAETGDMTNPPVCFHEDIKTMFANNLTL